MPLSTSGGQGGGTAACSRGAMAEDLLKAVSKELMSQDLYNKAAEEMLQQARCSPKD